MELSINSKTLLEAIKVVGACVKPKNTMPILDNLQFCFWDEGLRITADNLEIRTSITLETKSKGTFTTCVPYLALLNVLSVLANSPITLKFSKEELVLKSNSGTYKLPLVNDPFTEPKELDEATVIKDNDGEFVYGLKKAMTFVPTSDFENFNNVFFYLSENGSKMYSGLTAQIFECSLPIKSEERKALIPRQVADYLIKTISPTEEIEIGFTDSHLFVKLQNRTITAILSSGNAHDFPKLVARMNTKTNFSADREMIHSAVKKLHSIITEPYATLKFDISKNQVELSIDDLARSVSGKEVLPCNFDGGDFSIAFRSDFFIDSLNSLVEEELVNIGFISLDKPCLFTAENTKIILGPTIFKS